ncbi:hypothetical protein JYT36_00790, partial [Bacteroidales bacterium AH-315-N07]|nr:hypothetical protein [Bacteroidales bacterium AH-315-N07]
IHSMKIEHQEIIKLLSRYLGENPDQRFTQAIFNLGINEFANKENPEKENNRLRDVYNDPDGIVLDRMKRQIDYLNKEWKK